MTSNEKFTGLEKIDLAEAELHAPVEVTLAVYLCLPDGKIGTMRGAMPLGQLPSRADLALVLGSFTDADGEIPGAPRGARLLTRSQFVAHITKRELGEPFQMPLDAQYSPIPSDIPHAMLVHAIMGAVDIPEDLPVALFGELLRQGIAGGASYWNPEKMAELSDAELLALYARVKA